MNDLEWTEVTRARDRRKGEGRSSGSTQPSIDSPDQTGRTGPPPARGGEPAKRRKPGERRRRLRRRAVPLIALAAVSFIFGAVRGGVSADENLARDFAASWAAQDFEAMHAELTAESQAEYPLEEFTLAHIQSQTAATAETIDPGDAKETTDGARVQIAVDTTLFGEIDSTVSLPITDGEISWKPHMAFPGLRSGEKLGRRLSVVGKRASILAADGTPLAEGEAGSRTSGLGSAAIDVTGETGIPTGDVLTQVQTEGFSGEEPTGLSGLELAFNTYLAGQPKGDLLAVPDPTEGEAGSEPAEPELNSASGGRVLASGDGEPGRNVKTAIDPDMQQVAVAELAGRSGGIVVLDTRNGRVKAIAGQAYSNPQPPGSTFKVVTAVAALEKNVVEPDDEFPVLQEINAGGRVMSNAHDEFCGGTFVESFAHSCNTVFGPLGVEVGEEKLVETAERFGFNEAPTLYNEEITATIEPAGPTIPEDPGTDVDLAASAIGQGQLLATPLSMASVAQAIAKNGSRVNTPIALNPELRPEPRTVQATTPKIAKTLRLMMREVVTSGTGTRADLGNIRVAGKTGTAELGPKPDQPPPEPLAPGEEPPEPEQILDAWFIAFAPANKPRLAIGVVLVNADADGGEVAAPIAARVLDAGL